MIILIVLVFGVIEFELFLGLFNLIITAGELNVEEALYRNIKVGIKARFFLFIGDFKIAYYRYHTGKLSLDVRFFKLNLLILDCKFFPINFGPYCEPHSSTKTELLVTHDHNTSFNAKTDGLGTVAHLHRYALKHKWHSTPEASLVASRVACQSPLSCVEIGLSVGACHTLACLFFLVFVILLVIFLSREQALVEVGDTHILERDIGQLEVDILKTCNAYLTVEAELHKCPFILGQSVAIDDVEIGTVLVELYLRKHKVKAHFIVNLLHLEVHGKTVLLAMGNRLDVGKITYLCLFGSIFLAQERNFHPTAQAGTAEAVLLNVKIYIVECYLPTAQFRCSVCEETVHRCGHRESRGIINDTFHGNLHT